MASIQDLIDVQLADATGYADVENNDVLGTIFAHYWGPTPTMLRRYSQQQFRQNYPEVLPFDPEGSQGKNILNYMTLDAVNSYANLLKAFNNGMSTVEVKNLSNLKRFCILRESTADQESEGEWLDDSVIQSEGWALFLKYRGYVPSTLVTSGQLYINWSAPDPENNNLITIQVLNNTTVLEEFVGSFTPNTIIDGQDVYFGTLFQNSDFLGVWVAENTSSVNIISGGTSTYFLDEVITDINSDFDSDFKVFEDIKKSQATLLISPFNISSNENVGTVDTRLQDIANSKKTLNFVRGAHTLTELSNFVNGQIPVNNNQKFFNFYVLGQEQFKVFGKNITMNCVAGWCGSTAAVAKQVRLNQLASADAYGAYAGVLTWDPDFEYVLEAHKKGFITVYNSDEGPQIFGVRAYLKNQNTYYAKANVMRVLASILKNQIPVLLNGIHTDAAANPITRRILQSQMNSALNTYIGSQDIAPDSRVDMSDELNNDVATKGGQILFAIGYLHFYKLVEEIKYKIVATDSSVSVELS